MVQERYAATGYRAKSSSSPFSSPPSITPVDSTVSQASGLKKRNTARSDKIDQRDGDEHRPLLDTERDTTTATGSHSTTSAMSFTRRNQWIVYALASGACAAFNGVFAKLTTTELTSTFSQGIARLMHLTALESVIEFIVRCTFFGLNLAFNGVMWTLFTTALARGNSTTQVSIMNTSSNFVITAILGFAIFSEALPPLWWLGAAMLVAGNVIIGQKDEGVNGDTEPRDTDVSSASSIAEDGLGAYQHIPLAAPLVIPDGEEKDDEEAETELTADEDVPDLGDIEEN